METLRSFIPSLKPRIRQLNEFRRKGSKQTRELIRRHPVLALLAGIVGVCSVPVLACLVFCTALFLVLFFCVQGTLAGFTCIALVTVVGPIFFTGLSVVVFCYVVLKTAQRVVRIVKYVVSVPLQMWAKAITMIENMVNSGQLSTLTAPTSYHASPDDAHSFQDPAQWPASQTVRCQPDLPSMSIIDDMCLAADIPDTTTVRARSNELSFGHSALIDGEPPRNRISSSELRTAFRDMFEGRDPVEVLWPELPDTSNGRALKEFYRKRVKEIEERVCQSTDDDLDLPNSVGRNGNSRERHETPARNKMKNKYEKVYRKAAGKPLHRQESDSESVSSQTDSGRERSDNGLRRKQSEPERYRRTEHARTSSSDDNTFKAYSSRTVWSNRKQQRVSVDERAGREAHRRTKAQRFVMSDCETGCETDQLMRTSNSESSSVSTQRKRYRNEGRVHRIPSSESSSDSEQSDSMFYSNRRKHRATKKNFDRERQRKTSGSFSSRDEPPFTKEPVPTSSKRRPLHHKSRDRGSCDLYRVNYLGQRQVCPNNEPAVSSPSWLSHLENHGGTDYEDLTTNEERKFHDTACMDEEYVYY